MAEILPTQWYHSLKQTKNSHCVTLDIKGCIHKAADTPFNIQGDDLSISSCQVLGWRSRHWPSIRSILG